MHPRAIRLLAIALLSVLPALHAQDAAPAAPAAETLVITTAQGKGADAHVQGDNEGHKLKNADTNYGSAATILVKGSPNAAYHRALYLRFDLSALQGRKVANAELQLTAAADFKKWIVAGVYALKDPLPAAEGKLGLDWDEKALTWNNAPSQPATLESATREDSGAAQQLGEITFKHFKTDAVLLFRGPKLADAINNATSGTITLVIESGKDSQAVFHSKEGSAEKAPALKLTLAP